MGNKTDWKQIRENNYKKYLSVFNLLPIGLSFIGCRGGGPVSGRARSGQARRSDTTKGGIRRTLAYLVSQNNWKFPI